MDIYFEYYENNGKKIKSVCNTLLTKLHFGGISQKDYDDFYSIANLHFDGIVKSWDESIPFHNWLYSCLSRKFKTEMTRRNREKRTGIKAGGEIVNKTVSLEETQEIVDSIADDVDVELEVIGDVKSEAMEKYLSRLSKKSKKVLELLSDGIKPMEIREMLGMDSSQYQRCMGQIMDFGNLQILRKAYNIV